MKRVLDYLRFGAINKILPLTYDDSLSYYEMCCKMLSKINEIVAAYNDNFSDMVKDEIINNLTEENKKLTDQCNHTILEDKQKLNTTINELTTDQNLLQEKIRKEEEEKKKKEEEN